jgi:hypothetical protein
MPNGLRLSWGRKAGGRAAADGVTKLPQSHKWNSTLLGDAVSFKRLLDSGAALTAVVVTGH